MSLWADSSGIMYGKGELCPLSSYVREEGLWEGV